MDASALSQQSEEEEPTPSIASPQDVAAYVGEMTDALRRLTKRGTELAFLNYLLAMVSEEARQVAARRSH